MIDRLLGALGVDAVQWRALAGAYVRMDMRGAGGPHRFGEAPRQGIAAYRGLFIVTMLQGAVMAAMTAALENTFTATLLVATLVAFTTALLLLADFAGFVVSPNDYWILGSRPVSSRTYFAARLTAVLAHMALIAALTALLPSAALGIWHPAGTLGAVVAFVATVLCAITTTIVMIAVYAALMTRVRPQRLSRLVGYLQLASSMVFFGGYYFVARAFQEARIQQLSLGDIDWIWLVPSTWFAAFVPALTGEAGSREWVAVAAAGVLTAACVPLATGRLSLQYAERLAELSTATDAPARRSRVRLPGFGRGEAEAVATLIRAQFRHDLRFRLAILGILPLTVFYILMGFDGGPPSDPFVVHEPQGGLPLYFAVLFMPMTLHSALHYSDSWRASWIFFATPGDPAKVIVAAKNFVAVVVLGGYVLLLAIMFSFLYERVWHAFVHMAIVGGLAHLVLQCAVMLSPALPFASEPRKSDRSSRLFGLFLFASLGGGIIPLILPLVYALPVATAVLAVLLVVVTAALERRLRTSARAAILSMEM